ncbi:MAG: UbiA family prenyltransferase, partial [Desulfobacterales bacterium]
LGLFPLSLLLVMSLLGLSYNLRFVPKALAGIRYRRIRDIPGSKTILIAMAWGIVTAVLPSLSLTGTVSWITGLIFLWTVGIVFVRTTFFDILDMQGDRIVGKDTLAILLGEKRSMQILKRMLIALTIALIGLSAFHVVSYLGFVLISCPIFFLLLLSAYERGVLLPSIKLEFLVETNFILAGFAAALWSVFDV